MQGMAQKVAGRDVEQSCDGLLYQNLLAFVTFFRVIFVEFEIQKSVLKKCYSPE